MKTIAKRTALLTLLVLAFAGLAWAGIDAFSGVADGVRRADSKTVANFFDANVQLALPERDAMYSKAQAEMVLRTFFMKNPAKVFSIKHSGGAADGTQYAVGEYMSTGGKSFRTYFVLRKRGAVELLQEVRFEEQ